MAKVNIQNDKEQIIMAKKMDGKTMNITQENIAKMQELFPEVFTEGKIDFDKLQVVLGENIDKSNERYEFSWNGKFEAMKLAQLQSTGTLIPCKEKSKDWDKTQNLYIEGDNLEVLKLLQKSYVNQIKMIYIDPPYNTGNDFVYKDNFADNIANYKEVTGQATKSNAETAGRYHTNWLNMMYPRLKLARNLLKDDGVLFISIDDNEIENLRKICDEIFGECNFVAQFIWRGGRRNLAKFVSTSHEYILCFAKNLAYIAENNISWNENKKGLSEIYSKADELVKKYNKDYDLASAKLKEWYKSLPDDNDSKNNAHYCWIDKNGVYFASDISRGGGGGPKWQITNPTTGNVVQTPSRGWAYSSIEDLQNDINNGLVHFNGDGVPCKKRYLKDNETQVLETVFYKDRRGSSKRLRALMGADYFPYPKDEDVLTHYLSSFTDKNDIILDFFSGSATTAHAVMQLNAEDGGNRKFICVQLPERNAEDSEAFNAGYKTICEIGEERIRRAGQKIIEEHPELAQSLDVGFKVFKLESSNLVKWDNTPTEDVEELKQRLQQSLFYIVNGRTNEDLVYEIMLKYGLPLTLPIYEKQFGENKAYIVESDTYKVMICLDRNLSIDTIEQMTDEPIGTYVFADHCFADANILINTEEILKKKSKNLRIF